MTTPTLTAEQQAVVDYVKAHAHDPQSYQPVRWSKAVAYTRRDSAGAIAAVLSAQYSATANNPDIEGRAALIKQAIRLENVSDTTHIGTRLSHAYRLQGKTGAMLDSARFVVYRSGHVERL